MKMNRHKFLAAALTSAIAITLFTGCKTESTAQLTPAEAAQIAEDAYIYGYSLVTTEVTRVQTTDVPKVEPGKAPTGQFANNLRYPPADYRVFSAPNADTLYSLGWVDLAEPVVFSHPDMGKRFYLFEVVDLWMIDLASSPSARTANGSAANYLFTGPGWKGTGPAGMKHISMGTRYMAILGRTYTTGTEEDFKAVNELQAQYKFTPLSAWGKPYTPVTPAVDPNPGFSLTDNPQQAILAMSSEQYFNLMARLMGGAAPPVAEDAPIVARMAEIGIVPGKPFDMSKLDPVVQAALKETPEKALAKIAANKETYFQVINNWVVTKGLGVYGTNYLKRAVIAAYGWPANREQDAIYPTALVDSSGKMLMGANKYTMTFPKGATPPVNARGFWSITMYEVDKGWWFVPNALNKFTVSPRDKLNYNADGSLTLYFQTESPGADMEANWLPAPKGEFIPMLRMYWPNVASPSILNDTWKIPAIQKVN